MSLTKQENIALHASKLLEALSVRNLSMATAESCTGGLIAASVTEVPGSSKVFLGGVVSYANEIKMDLLGVKDQTLEEFGAVSEACALEMVAGALQNMGSDVAVSVTGVAGPTGGSADKPIGTVWIGVGNPKKIRATRYFFQGNRTEIRLQSALEAILALINFCNEEYP